MSAMSKKKWHTYCVFEHPNPYESRVVTGQNPFFHTLQHFWEVIFPFFHTLQHFREVDFSLFALGASGEPEHIWGGFGEALRSLGEALGSVGESLGKEEDGFGKLWGDFGELRGGFVRLWKALGRL